MWYRKIPLYWPFILGCVCIAYLTSQSLSPFNGGMFGFHDPTQVGRVSSFVNNLKTGHIPPRLAPEYSFNLGFPVFNFYAPTAYWITSAIVLMGFSSITAVKLSFLLTVIGAFWGMYYFLQQLFSTRQKLFALVGASVYVTSTYVATEIVVRGNLSESWFLALLPICLGLVIHNSRTHKRIIEVLTGMFLALLFTSHNMMMLFAVPIVFTFIFFFPKKRKNFWVCCLALLIDSYFLIPAIVEGRYVQAASIAKEYPYELHFLCAWQWWKANGWQFGGSLLGCDADTMSFKIGKVQLMLGFIGLVWFFWKMILIVRGRHFLKEFKKQNTIDVFKKIVSTYQLELALFFLAIVFIGSLFLTLSYSKFIWDKLAFVMALFQFPWRFMVFGVFGSAVFSGYLFYTLHFPFKNIVMFGILLILFVPARKYFIKPLTPLANYEQQFNSPEYLSKHLAFKMPEYIAVGVDKEYWRSLEPHPDRENGLRFDVQLPVDFSGKFEVMQNDPFNKTVVFKEPGEASINLHYYPFWKITLNDEHITPDRLDNLARPMMMVNAEDNVHIWYQQTKTENISNGLTILGFILLLYKSSHKYFAKLLKVGDKLRK